MSEYDPLAALTKTDSDEAILGEETTDQLASICEVLSLFSGALERQAVAMEKIASTLEALTGLQERVETVNQVAALKLVGLPTHRGLQKLAAMGTHSVWHWDGDNKTPHGQAMIDGDTIVIVTDGADPVVIPRFKV